MHSKELNKIATEYLKELSEYVTKGKINEYFDEVVSELGINFIVAKDGYILGVNVCVATGGPNVFINTYENKINVYWTNEGGAFIDPSISKAINNYYREIYNFEKD